MLVLSSVCFVRFLAFLAVVRKADDYALFAASMRGATKHARWLEEPD